jgi:hypothetical protein
MIRHLMKQLGVRDAAGVGPLFQIGLRVADLGHAGCGLNVGVTTGSFTREQLSAFPHSHILESVAGLPDLLISRA